MVPSALAQDVPGPPSWSDLPLPDEVTQTFFIQNVQRTLASAFDPTLPATSFDTWLWSTFAPIVEPVRPPRVEWRVSFCADTISEIPHASSPELCVEGTVALSAEKNVKMAIAVADAVRGSRTGRLRWRPKLPSVKEVYLERLKDSVRVDSLDVPTLGALPQLLDAPFEEWPTVDFESTIIWDPPKPVPGEKTRFSISIRNTGKRSVDRACIEILISPCCANVGEVRHESCPRITAGWSVRAEIAVRLPEGRALASVSVKPWQGHKIVRQSSAGMPATVVPVGYPPRPR